MSFTLVTPPKPVLDLADVKRHVRAEGFTDDDALLDALIEAATSHIDGPEGWLGRCLGPQTWDWTIDAISDDGMSWSNTWALNRSYVQIPVRPVISVDAITYLDGDGVRQSWTDFVVFGLGSTGPARIQPTLTGHWPSVISQPEAVTVRFTAGYAKGDGETSEGTVEAVPYAIKAALKLIVGDLYQFRETVGDAKMASIPMSASVEALLNPYRIWET